MNNLIPIRSGQLAGEAVQTVNARDLHEFLKVEARFNDWIVRRIEEYGFEEAKDFYSILSKSSGGRPAKDYHLSLDMAKELAMVEKTTKGREARRYFIDCERRAKAAAAPRLESGRTFATVTHQDLVAPFLDECATPAPGGRIKASVVYQAFQEWCRNRGIGNVPSSIAFGRSMVTRVQKIHNGRNYWWLGLALRPALGSRAQAPIAPLAGFDASFSRRIGRLSADFYDSFREALMRCDALYREHRFLLRTRFPRAEQDHDMSELLRNAEGAGLSMIETADDSLNAALRQMRSVEHVYRLAARTGA